MVSGVDEIVEVPRGSTIFEGVVPGSNFFEQGRTQWGRRTGIYTINEVVISLETPAGLPVEEVIYTASKNVR